MEHTEAHPWQAELSLIISSHALERTLSHTLSHLRTDSRLDQPTSQDGSCGARGPQRSSQGMSCVMSRGSQRFSQGRSTTTDTQAQHGAAGAQRSSPGRSTRINVCEEGACARSRLLTAPLCAVAQVLGNIFGTKNTSEMEAKATLDHLSQITQVPPLPD